MRKILFSMIVMLIFAVASAINASAYECTGNYFTYQSHEYCSYSKDATWYEAKSDCESGDWHLVTIGSKGENDAISSMGGKYWIGFTDETAEGSWRWVTKEPVSYTNWDSGEPNNMGDEDHATLIGATGKWVDSLYYHEGISYVCENDGVDESPECTRNTLIDERFNSGLSKWQIYGMPKPYIDAAEGSLNNNGDSMWESGILSYTSVDFSNGAEITFDGKDSYHCTPPCWEGAVVGLTRQSSRGDGDSTKPIVGIAVGGEGEYIGFIMYDEVKAKIPLADAEYHSLKMVIRPDLYVDFYVDGSLKYTSTTKLSLDDNNAYVTAYGRSYHGGSRVDNIYVSSCIDAQMTECTGTPSFKKLEGASVVNNIISYEDRLYASTSPNAEVFVSDDGEVWKSLKSFRDEIGTPSGEKVGAGATIFDGHMLVATGGDTGIYDGAAVFVGDYKDGDFGSWEMTKINTSNVGHFLQVGNSVYASTSDGVYMSDAPLEIGSWKNIGLKGQVIYGIADDSYGRIYAINAWGNNIYVYDGSWKTAYSNPGYDRYDDILRASDGRIYVTARATNRADILVSEGSTFTLLNQVPGAERATRIFEEEGYLYAGTRPNGRIYRMPLSGGKWKSVVDMSTFNYKLDTRSFLKHDGKYYAGLSGNSYADVDINERSALGVFCFADELPQPPNPPPTKECDKDSDCGNGRQCNNGRCVGQQRNVTPRKVTCTESDNGRDFSKKGAVYLDGEEYADFCYNYEADVNSPDFGECEGNDADCVVVEHSCVDGNLLKERYSCPEGCYDGACAGKQEKECDKDSQCGKGRQCNNGRCVGQYKFDECEFIGYRKLDGESKNSMPVYCDIDNDYKPQKGENVACQNDFECLTNHCMNGHCIDIEKQLKETQGMLAKIMGWLGRLFGSEKTDAGGAYA